MPAKPFTEIVREMRARREKLDRLVRWAMDREKIFKAELRGSRGFLTLTRSTRPGVQYQLTYWDHDQTPTGHLDEQSIEDAVRDISGAIELDY